MKKVKLTKLAEALNPTVPNNIPSGDTRIGIIKEDPTVGKGLFMEFVIEKNGKSVKPGRFFYTSNIQEILEETDTTVIFKTFNSIYQLEVLSNEIKLTDIL